MQRMLPPTVGLKCGGASFSGPRPVTCSRAVGVARNEPKREGDAHIHIDTRTAVYTRTWQRLPRALSTGPRSLATSTERSRAKRSDTDTDAPPRRGARRSRKHGSVYKTPGSVRGPAPAARIADRDPHPILSILTRFYRLKGQAHAFFKAVMPPPVAHLCDGGGLCDSWAPAPPMFPP